MNSPSTDTNSSAILPSLQPGGYTIPSPLIAAHAKGRRTERRWCIPKPPSKEECLGAANRARVRRSSNKRGVFNMASMHMHAHQEAVFHASESRRRLSRSLQQSVACPLSQPPSPRLWPSGTTPHWMLVLEVRAMNARGSAFWAWCMAPCCVTPTASLLLPTRLCSARGRRHSEQRRPAERGARRGAARGAGGAAPAAAAASGPPGPLAA
jgi:hypothetical protein